MRRCRRSTHDKPREGSPAPVTILATGQWLVTADTPRYHVGNDPVFPGQSIANGHGCRPGQVRSVSRMLVLRRHLDR